MKGLVGYRGDILYFTDDPSKASKNSSASSAYKYYPDGVLYVQNGKIIEAGKYNELKQKYKQAGIIDYSGKLILPGFIDTHVHYPQVEMIASYGHQLLDWLNNYTFPTEQKFKDPEYASQIAKFFLEQLINNGTTTAMVFATVDPVSVEAFFNAALQRNMRMISGKVLMDRNAPSDLLDTPETAYSDSKKLIEHWHIKGRLKYAVTPRFAPTSSNAQLAVAGKLLKEFPGVYMQTHLAENKQEVEWVKQLFPDSRSYLDVYDYYGLVNEHSVFAHSIYIDNQDCKVLAENNSAIAFCPSSNLFLGSGLFNLNKAKEYEIKVGLGTDVGAGTSLSMIQTMSEAYKVCQLRKSCCSEDRGLNISIDNDLDKEVNLDPFEALYLATLGGARALSLDQYIGSFLPGKEADFVVLNTSSIAILDLRVKNSKTLGEKLFAIQTLGDDRAIEHVYIMGNIIEKK